MLVGVTGVAELACHCLGIGQRWGEVCSYLISVRTEEAFATGGTAPSDHA